MGQPEHERIREILATLPKYKRLFRSNSGVGWTGKILEKTRDFIKIAYPRPFHGMPVGYPDLAGWTEVEITPELVGQRVAVWTGVEVKVTGRLSGEQKAFKELIEEMGGIYIVDRG